jgi:hypothetical protein
VAAAESEADGAPGGGGVDPDAGRVIGGADRHGCKERRSATTASADRTAIQRADFIDKGEGRVSPGKAHGPASLPLPGKNHYDVIDGFLDAESTLCSAILRGMNARQRTPVFGESPVESGSP